MIPRNKKINHYFKILKSDKYKNAEYGYYYTYSGNSTLHHLDIYYKGVFIVEIMGGLDSSDNGLKESGDAQIESIARKAI